MLIPVLLDIFLILHGLVHLLYAGYSWWLFELQAGLRWPDDSWLFARLTGDHPARWLANISLALAALGFVVGGLGLFLQQDWWRLTMMGAALFSSVIFFLFWDGRFKALDAQGGVGVLVNLAIIAIVVIY
jgi:hypothetical protein